MIEALGAEQCALCLGHHPLQKSHVIPKFVIHYLKDTSATGYLRDATQPNRRIQDFATERLLCSQCEQRFSVWEKEFSEKSFPLLQSDGFRSLDHGPNLLKFAVSLSWRVLVLKKGYLQSDFPRFATRIDSIVENWRRYLIGDTQKPGSEHHLFVFAGLPAAMPDGLHRKILQYTYRGIDATPVAGKEGIGIYVKLLRCMFISPIDGLGLKRWRNTRIHAGPGQVTSPQTVTSNWLTDFMNSRVEELFKTQLSPRQQDRIAASMKQNPNRTLQSESLNIAAATIRHFGE